MEVSEQIQEELNQALAEIKAKNNEEVSEDIKSEVVPEDVKSEDPYLDEAVKAGYDPDYKGPNRKTPEQFVKDGSFFKKIDAQNKKIEELTKVVKQSLSHNEKLEKAAFDKAARELDQARDQAIMEGDLNAVKVIEEQKNIVLEQRMAKNQEEPIPAEITPDLQEFLSRNGSWFNHDTPENSRMVKAADLIDKLIAEELNEKGQRLSQKDHLKLVEERLREIPMFSHKFPEDMNKKAALTTRSTVSEGNHNDKGLAGRLTKQQKDFVKQARTYGSKLTEEAYAKQLKLTGELSDG